MSVLRDLLIAADRPESSSRTARNAIRDSARDSGATHVIASERRIAAHIGEIEIPGSGRIVERRPDCGE